MCVHAKSLQSCLTLCNSMNHSLPGSTVHGIPQARILEWVAISFSRGSSWSWIPTYVSYISCSGSWEATQPCVRVCICIYIFSFRFFSIIGYYKIVEHSFLCCVVCLSNPAFPTSSLFYSDILIASQLWTIFHSWKSSLTPRIFAIKPMRWLNSPIFQMKILSFPG